MTTEDDEEELLMAVANLFSKEMFLTRRLTHGHATNDVRLQVLDRFSRIRPELKNFLYSYINPDNE